MGGSVKKHHRDIFFFLGAVFIVGLALSIARMPADDEVYYLNDALEMSRSIAEGKWIGRTCTGFHGFLFKLPAALLFLITGPSVFAATLVTLFLALASLYLCYRVFKELLGDPDWVLAGVFMVASGVFFLRTLPTFLRDIPVLFTLLLLLYLVLKKAGKWWIGLSLLLVLDAKEGVFFLVLPAVSAWVIISEVFNRGQDLKPLFKRLADVSGRLFAAFLPSLLLMLLMFTTTLVPLNRALARVLGFTSGGMETFLQDTFAPDVATSNPEDGGREIYRFRRQEAVQWTALSGGGAVTLPEFITRDKLPVVKLTKPARPSTHESGDYYHECTGLMEPAQCRSGDVLVFSFWYKAPQKLTRDINAVAQYRNIDFPSYREPVPLQGDSQWHYVETRITIVEPGVMRVLLIWPMARDMVLYVAGCSVKIEKKNAALPVKWTTAGQAGLLPKNASGEPETSGRLWQLWQKLAAWLNLLLAYIGKIFYPRTFSITSIPRFIVLPALIMSFAMFRRWKQEKQYQKLLLPLVCWSYLAGYLMRISMGRYLLPASPVIILFFLFFLKEGLKKRTFARNTLVAATLFEVLSWFFEVKYPLFKLGLTAFFLALFWLLYYRQHNRGGDQDRNRHKLTYAVIIGVFCATVYLGSEFANVRQLARYFTWGYACQARQVARLLKPNEKTWINTGRGMVEFYRNDGTFTPFKKGMLRWVLLDWVPKANLVKAPPPASTVFFQWENEQEFRHILEEHHVHKVVMAVSTRKGEKYAFPYQERLPVLLNSSFLEFEKKIPLKNKTLYVFIFNDRD